MNWTSALSENPVLEEAIAECGVAIKNSVGGETLDLAVAFISPHYEDSYDRVADLMAETLGAKHVFGCSGGGVIGNGLEVEQRAGISITAAVLPDVDIKPFHLQVDRLPDLDAGPDKWEDLIGVQADKDPHFVMLADPYSFPVQDLLMGMDYAYPKATKIGGLASGASREGGNALFLDDQVLRTGAIGLALDGNITVDTVVAQGCRPIGNPMRISKSDRNMLVELDGQPPMEVLRNMMQVLPERDQELIRYSLFLGVVTDELIDYIHQNYTGHPDHVAANKASVSVPYDHGVDLPNIKAPSLIIWGRYDRMCVFEIGIAALNNEINWFLRVQDDRHQDFGRIANRIAIY